MALRIWGNEDRGVRKRIEKTDRKRLGYISGIFRDMGFRGKEPENRGRLFILYHAYLHNTFLDDPDAAKRMQVRAFNKLLME